MIHWLRDGKRIHGRIEKTLNRKSPGILIMVLCVLACPSFAEMHQSRQFRLALTCLGKPTTDLRPQVRGLRDGLEEARYIDGKNILIDHLQDEDEGNLRQRLQQRVQRGLDVIVTTGSIDTAIAQRLTDKTPIVFAPALDPVRMGFVKSRSHPGTNLTGLSFKRGSEDTAKQLSMFKQVFPSMRRVTMFYDRRNSYSLPIEARGTIERVARRSKIQLTLAGIGSSDEATGFLDNATDGATDGVFPTCTSLLRDFKSFATVTARKRIPLFGCTATQVADEGATMTYAPDLYLMGYRGAWYVDRILRGADPAQLPVETPSRMELIINLKNARAIGLNIPIEQLILADKVFQ